MADIPIIGPLSKHLPLDQRRRLEQAQEALSQGDSARVQEILAGFLVEAYRLTSEKLLKSFKDIDPMTLEIIRVGRSKRWNQFRRILWKDGRLSDFASRMLAWRNGDLLDAELGMSIAELNTYLEASLGFYDALPAPESKAIVETTVPSPPVFRVDRHEINNEELDSSPGAEEIEPAVAGEEKLPVDEAEPAVADEAKLPGDDEAELKVAEEIKLPADGQAELAVIEEAKLPVDEAELKVAEEEKLPGDDEAELKVAEEIKLPADGQAEPAVADEEKLPGDDEAELKVAEEIKLPADGQTELAVADEAKLPVDDEAELAVAEEIKLPADGQAEPAVADEAKLPVDDEAELKVAEEIKLPADGQTEPAVADEEKLPGDDEAELKVAEEIKLPADGQAELAVAEEAKLPGDDEAELSVIEEAKLPVGDEAELAVADEAKLPVDDEAELAVAEEIKLPADGQAEPAVAEEVESAFVDESQSVSGDDPPPLAEVKLSAEIPATLGSYSVYLPPGQRASLRLLDKALAQGRRGAARQEVQSFLLAAYLATRETILFFFTDLDLETLEAIRDNRLERWHELSVVLWKNGHLTTFGKGLLTWHEAGGSTVTGEALMSIEELNIYLEDSMGFYASLRLGSSEVTPEMRAGEEPEPPRITEVSWSAHELEERSTRTREERRGMTAATYDESNAYAHLSELNSSPSSSAPLSPLEAKELIAVEATYLGYGKNEDGVMGYCGKISVSRGDDQQVEARLDSSNPLLFLSSTILVGVSPTVSYWMPPAAFPQPGGHLSIRTAHEAKVLSVTSLFPQSRTEFLKGYQVLIALLAPSLVGLLYFCFVYTLSAHKILSQVQLAFPESYRAYLAGASSGSFRGTDIGIFQLEVLPASESLQLIWAAVIWLAPLLAIKFFRHLSRVRRRNFSGLLALSLVLPTLGLLGAWKLQRVLWPLFSHADFMALNLGRLLAWSAPLNAVVAIYLFTSVYGVWDRKIKAPELRVLLPVVLTIGYVLICFFVIFWRSWLS